MYVWNKITKPIQWWKKQEGQERVTDKQYYIYIEIYAERVSKSGTGRGDQGRKKRRKER
jgi:hypothetical protein